jgi:hypothetical protein
MKVNDPAVPGFMPDGHRPFLRGDRRFKNVLEDLGKEPLPERRRGCEAGQPAHRLANSPE